MFIVCSCSFSLCKIIHPVEMDPKTFVQPCISRTSSGNTGTVILGRYEIGRLLGRGSFAKVYQGRALSDDIPVAIKVIEKPPPMEAASMEPRIVREVSAMRRLNPHPNILKLHEVMATKTKIYLVMELAPGGELFAKLSRRGRFTEPAARRYFQQLVSALHFCHQNGVAHRDVKPQNLLLDQLGNLKVSDFGLSALPEQINNGMLHTACGTPAYTAPEVVRRKGYDGPKADAWSCGIILFVFLAGQLPFDDSNLPNMYRKIHYREFEIPDWVSKPARYIIQRLLDPNPSTRMSIEGLMGLAWFKKSLQLQPQCSHIGLEECKDEKRMNAFDIISMSSGLDLSGLFEANLSQKERRFPSGEKVEVIEERVKQVGGRLGYRVEKGKGGVIGLVKEKTVLLVKIMEVTGELSWVELKVVGEIGGVEWEELRVGLEDILVPLHNESC